MLDQRGHLASLGMAMLARRPQRLAVQWPLAEHAAAQLAAAGIGTIEPLGLDTYADPDRFYSFRRATHLNEPDYGRHINAIALSR
jgi:copper oxidase (laccase) domain-containing protein